MRSLTRHAQKVRPQVQEATIFLISLHRVTPVSGLPEQTLLTGCGVGRGSCPPWKCPLSWRKSLAPAAEMGVEGSGHDPRGARTAVSADVGAAVAVPAGGVGHGPGPQGKSWEYYGSLCCAAVARTNCHQSRRTAGRHRFLGNGACECPPDPPALKRHPRLKIPDFAGFRADRRETVRAGCDLRPLFVGRVPFARSVCLLWPAASSTLQANGSSDTFSAIPWQGWAVGISATGGKGAFPAIIDLSWRPA